MTIRMVAHTHGSAAPASLLAAGLAALQLHLGAPAQSALLAYLALLGKWNRVYNLTAIDDPRKMITHHLLDSLAVAPHVHGPRVLDVGSGAGLPGIPLAVALPALIGLYPADEIAALPAVFQAEACIRLNVPGLNEARHAVCLRRSSI